MYVIFLSRSALSGFPSVAQVIKRLKKLKYGFSLVEDEDVSEDDDIDLEGLSSLGECTRAACDVPAPLSNRTSSFDARCGGFECRSRHIASAAIHLSVLFCCCVLVVVACRVGRVGRSHGDAQRAASGARRENH